MILIALDMMLRGSRKLFIRFWNDVESARKKLTRILNTRWKDFEDTGGKQLLMVSESIWKDAGRICRCLWEDLKGFDRIYQSSQILANPFGILSKSFQSTFNLSRNPLECLLNIFYVSFKSYQKSFPIIAKSFQVLPNALRLLFKSANIVCNKYEYNWHSINMLSDTFKESPSTWFHHPLLIRPHMISNGLRSSIKIITESFRSPFKCSQKHFNILPESYQQFFLHPSNTMANSPLSFQVLWTCVANHSKITSNMFPNLVINLHTPVTILPNLKKTGSSIARTHRLNLAFQIHSKLCHNPSNIVYLIYLPKPFKISLKSSTHPTQNLATSSSSLIQILVKSDRNPAKSSHHSLKLLPKVSQNPSTFQRNPFFFPVRAEAQGSLCVLRAFRPSTVGGPHRGRRIKVS